MKLLGDWTEDSAYAAAYDWSVEHPRLGGLAWRVGMGSDLALLHGAAAELGRLPDGARVLDVPCGGGVALRGLRPDQQVEHVALDISTTMLRRTQRRAARLGVAGVVRPVQGDVGALPFGDGSFDLVATFTGLHCFPDPRRAVGELGRVLRPGGVLTGSAFLNDTGRQYEPSRRVGRATGILGPGCTGGELVQWLTAAGVEDLSLRVSGAIGYFRGRLGLSGSPRTP